MAHTRIRKFNTKDTYPEQSLDNDANAAAYGEYWVGSGEDVGGRTLEQLGAQQGGTGEIQDDPDPRIPRLERRGHIAERVRQAGGREHRQGPGGGAGAQGQGEADEEEASHG